MQFINFDEMIVELSAAGAILNETSKVARLLLTLPNSYLAVVSAIQTLSDESLSLAFVKTWLLDYKIKLRSDSGETSRKVLHVETQNQDKKQNFESKRKWKSPRPNSKKKPFHHQKREFKNSKINPLIMETHTTDITTKIK